MPPSLMEAQPELDTHKRFAVWRRTGDKDSLPSRETYAEAIPGHGEAPSYAHMSAALIGRELHSICLCNWGETNRKPEQHACLSPAHD
jgi:hypothetical protein